MCDPWSRQWVSFQIFKECFDIEIGTMKENEITDDFLKGHVDACIYYGIPPVITSDKKLNARVNKLLNEYDERNI